MTQIEEEKKHGEKKSWNAQHAKKFSVTGGMWKGFCVAKQIGNHMRMHTLWHV